MRRIALLLASVLVLVACSDSGDDPPAAGPSSTGPSSTGPSSTTSTTRPSTTSTTGQGVGTILAAGDIASCASQGDEATAALLDARPNAVVVTLGDNVYDSGTASEFANCYDPSWGRHKARTRPALGNHEYGVFQAGGYFGAFGAAAGEAPLGWYSFDLGARRSARWPSGTTPVGRRAPRTGPRRPWPPCTPPSTTPAPRSS
ncbi:MAG: metallophosphoesterase [Actinomycetota bacterium]|nr:metallophosphoesterase [Actinomycetota bacterium]